MLTWTPQTHTHPAMKPFTVPSDRNADPHTGMQTHHSRSRKYPDTYTQRSVVSKQPPLHDPRYDALARLHAHTHEVVQRSPEHHAVSSKVCSVIMRCKYSQQITTVNYSSSAERTKADRYTYAFSRHLDVVYALYSLANNTSDRSRQTVEISGWA